MTTLRQYWNVAVMALGLTAGCALSQAEPRIAPPGQDSAWKDYCPDITVPIDGLITRTWIVAGERGYQSADPKDPLPRMFVAQNMTIDKTDYKTTVSFYYDDGFVRTNIRYFTDNEEQAILLDSYRPHEGDGYIRTDQIPESTFVNTLPRFERVRRFCQEAKTLVEKLNEVAQEQVEFEVEKIEAREKL